MTVNVDIEGLLKQDEAQLRAKKKRLKSLASALEELRLATKKAADSASEIMEHGDLTRGDLAKVFDLTKGERMTLLPANPRRSGTSRTQSSDQPEHATPDATQSTSNSPSSSL